MAALRDITFFAAVIVGVIGAWVHGFASANWGWGPTQPLILGVGLAALLSVLAFLPTDQSKRMQGAIDVAALNFIIGVGFGLLVPYFAA